VNDKALFRLKSSAFFVAMFVILHDAEMVTKKGWHIKICQPFWKLRAEPPFKQ
jgi:hypothetical protein